MYWWLMLGLAWLSVGITAPLVPTTVVYLASTRAPASARVKFHPEEVAILRAYGQSKPPKTIQALRAGQRWNETPTSALPSFVTGQILPDAQYQRAYPVPFAVLRHLPNQPPGTALFVLPHHIIRLALPSKEVVDVIQRD